MELITNDKTINHPCAALFEQINEALTEANQAMNRLERMTRLAKAKYNISKASSPLAIAH